MKNLLTLFLIVALSSACTKFGKNVTIKGRVLNPITGQGIEGAEIWLQRGTAGLPGGTKTVKTATTDANGNYELNKLGYSHYQAICVIGDRYALGWTQDSGESYMNPYLAVKRGKTMQVDFHAVEYGSLIINVNNQNCEGATDVMKFQFKTQFDNDFGYFTPEFTGCFSIFPTNATKTPMGQRIYKLTVNRPSGTVFVYDTVFVSQNGTSNVNLFY
jgi:hypothetical protein